MTPRNHEPVLICKIFLGVMSLLCRVYHASTKRVVVLGDTEWTCLTDLDSHDI